MEMVPAPDTTGSCGVWKGPGFTWLETIRLPSANTLTVEGTAAEPAADGMGKVMRSGRILKSERI